MYRRDIEEFAAWYEEEIGEALKPERLESEHLQRYQRRLENDARANPFLIQRRLKAIRAYVTWAHETGQIPYSDLRYKPKSVEEKDRKKWLEPADQSRLVQGVTRRVKSAHTSAARRRAAIDYALVALFMNLGLTIGELCRMIIRPDHPGEDALLISDKGNGVTPNAVQRRFSTLSERIGIKITPHDLRHTCIKNLINAGTPIHVVSELVGVSSFNFFKVYYESQKPDLPTAVQALEKAWGRTP